MRRTSMDRRTLLRYAAGGAAAAVSGIRPSVGATPEPSRAVTPSDPAAGIAPFELDELSFLDLQKRMETGAETARSITAKYLARIEALDRRGPELRSVLETNPDALPIADALDKERKAGHLRGPLHGAPILLKDNIGTADRMTTTAGSLALEG